MRCGLKKLSITNEEAEKVKELVSKKLTGRKIAMELNISQSTIWRNMEFLGLNKKPTPKDKKKFNWKDFNNSVI